MERAFQTTPACGPQKEGWWTMNEQVREDSARAGREYRFTRLALPLVMRDMYYSGRDPGPGDRMPEFDLPTVAGGRIRRSDLAATGPLLLVFGSSTCPVTDHAAPGLKDLHRRYADKVRFVMVNVREAHPGASIPQPTEPEAKRRHAQRLRDLHGFGFDVAVDDIDGSLHRALGPKPNAAYLVGRNGVILFRAQWANDTRALEEALAAVSLGQAPRRSSSGGLVRPILGMSGSIAPVLDRAGPGAWADMWRVAPPLAAMAFIRKQSRARRRKA
jgi:thiol-disulfide isomerase/thioredoxin